MSSERKPAWEGAVCYRGGRARRESNGLTRIKPASLLTFLTRSRSVEMPSPGLVPASSVSGPRSWREDTNTNKCTPFTIRTLL